MHPSPPFAGNPTTWRRRVHGAFCACRIGRNFHPTAACREIPLPSPPPRIIENSDPSAVDRQRTARPSLEMRLLVSRRNRVLWQRANTNFMALWRSSHGAKPQERSTRRPSPRRATDWPVRERACRYIKFGRRRGFGSILARATLCLCRVAGSLCCYLGSYGSWRRQW